MQKEDQNGLVTGIYISSAATHPMESVAFVKAIAGQGLEGDRYAKSQGTFLSWPDDHEFTLIEAEAIEDITAKTDLTFAPGEMRRNVTTHGIRLNDLVGKRFWIGIVLCEGTRLCEPCSHLETLLQKPGLCRFFSGRGGLRAKILTDGVIHVNDTFKVDNFLD